MHENGITAKIQFFIDDAIATFMDRFRKQYE